MYRLSKDEDLSFFIDAQINQVCVGANELILHFDPRVGVGTDRSRVGERERSKRAGGSRGDPSIRSPGRNLRCGRV